MNTKLMISLVALSWTFTILWSGYFSDKADVMIVSLIAVVGLTALCFDLHKQIPKD